MTVESKERRKALQLFGATSLVALAGGVSAQQVCKNGGESTAGPYPDLRMLNRKDLRANSTGNTTIKPGALLTLRVRVVDILNNCAPIPNAVVDIWSADATGRYSGYSSFNTTGQDFCRGYQVTDANGIAEFNTLFPGSYTGRAIHIHAAVRKDATTLSPNAHGRNLSSVFVCQFYFSRAVVDQVFNANSVYRGGAPITSNGSDSIYLNEGGASYIVNVTGSGSSYTGTVDIGTTRAGIGNPAGGTTPGAQTYTNSTIYAIRDNATVSSPITVSGRTGFGSATTPVAVNIAHTYRGDLKVDLVAPDGSLYTLKNYNSGDSADNVNQTFTVNLSGEALNGTWNLRVTDNSTNDTGSINGWSITF